MQEEVGYLTRSHSFKECSGFTIQDLLKINNVNSIIDKGKYLVFLGVFFGSHDAGDSPILGLMMAQPNRCIGSASAKSPNTTASTTASQISSCKEIHHD